MKSIRKLSIAVCLAMIACLPAPLALPARAGLIATPTTSKPVLTQTRATLYVGKTLQLRVLGTKQAATWSSSDKRVAKVSKKGLVKALKVGKAKITAKVGKKKLTCAVTVKCPEPPAPTPVDPWRAPGRRPVAYKPIIYLYPEAETELTVALGKPALLTAAYPEYPASGWHVLARPDGTLESLDTGRRLYALYWEGNREVEPAIDEGFLVAGSDTAAFLEEKLAALGLNDREAEEFIIYWLPVMQANPYNLVRFETPEEIDAAMPLDFSVAPDTLIRVMMDFKPLEAPVKVPEQALPQAPVRRGFTAVEWGGCPLQ